MRKIIFALTILVLAAPALADVTITATDEGGGVVAITYVASGEPSKVRAFGLNITVDSGCDIDAIDDFNTGDNNGYGIFMDNIVIDGNGLVTSFGNPVAPSGAPGALGGLGTGGITVEMGSLYEDGNAPDDSGTLCRITVNDNGASDCNLALAAEDVHRGGVVSESGSTITPVLEGTKVTFACFPSAHADYSEWLSVGSPASWCYVRQCHGDADNATEQIGKPTFHVGYNDLAIFLSDFKNTTPSMAADFDHASEQIGKPTFRVGYNDLAIFLANFKNSTVNADCLDVP